MLGLSQKLPNNLRLKTLGNKEISGKSQNWVQTFSPVSLQEIKISNSAKKWIKSDIKLCIMF